MMKPDRRTMVIGVLILAAAACIFLFRTVSVLEKENRTLLSQREEMLQLRKDFSELRDRVQSIEGKKSITKSEGIVQSVDEVFKSLGLSGKVKSLKSTGAKQQEFGVEEEAELQVERVTMNELVNIFYKIEHAQAILTVKKASMKTVFDSPSLLNITMTIGFIKPK